MRIAEILNERTELKGDLAWFVGPGSSGGKFWFDAKSGVVCRVQDSHHAVAAFSIPATAEAIRSVIGDSFDQAKAAIEAAFEEFSQDDTQAHERYYELHDATCNVLFRLGWVRGNHNLGLFLSLHSRFERACRDLVAMINPIGLQFDLEDLGTCGRLDGPLIDLFLRGRSLRAFTG